MENKDEKYSHWLLSSSSNPPEHQYIRWAEEGEKAAGGTPIQDATGETYKEECDQLWTEEGDEAARGIRVKNVSREKYREERDKFHKLLQYYTEDNEERRRNRPSCFPKLLEKTESDELSTPDINVAGESPSLSSDDASGGSSSKMQRDKSTGRGVRKGRSLITLAERLSISNLKKERKSKKN